MNKRRYLYYKEDSLKTAYLREFPWGAFDSAKNHKRQSVTAKREKLQTPKFV